MSVSSKCQHEIDVCQECCSWCFLQLQQVPLLASTPPSHTAFPRHLLGLLSCYFCLSHVGHPAGAKHIIWAIIHADILCYFFEGLLRPRGKMANANSFRIFMTGVLQVTESYPNSCSVPLHKDKISVVLTMHVSGSLLAYFAEHHSLLFLCWLFCLPLPWSCCSGSACC